MPAMPGPQIECTLDKVDVLLAQVGGRSEITVSATVFVQRNRKWRRSFDRYAEIAIWKTSLPSSYVPISAGTSSSSKSTPKL